MDNILAKLRRRGLLSLLLGLLLFGNELAHLCYHEHLHAASAEHAVGRQQNGYPGLEASPHHLAGASAGEFSCPCCSSAIDRLCSPASAEPQSEPPPATVVRRDPAPPVFRFIPRHPPRSPPLA